MAFTNFNEAIVVLHWMSEELQRLTDETAPLEAEYHDRWKAAHDPATGDRIGVAGDRIVMYQEEFQPYYDALVRLSDIAGAVEDRLAAIQREHWGPLPVG